MSSANNTSRYMMVLIPNRHARRLSLAAWDHAAHCDWPSAGLVRNGLNLSPPDPKHRCADLFRARSYVAAAMIRSGVHAGINRQATILSFGLVTAILRPLNASTTPRLHLEPPASNKTKSESFALSSPRLMAPLAPFCVSVRLVPLGGEWYAALEAGESGLNQFSP